MNAQVQLLEGRALDRAPLPAAVLAPVLGDHQEDAPQRQDTADAEGGNRADESNHHQRPTEDDPEDRAAAHDALAVAFGALGHFFGFGGDTIPLRTSNNLNSPYNMRRLGAISGCV